METITKRPLVVIKIPELESDKFFYKLAFFQPPNISNVVAFISSKETAQGLEDFMESAQAFCSAFKLDVYKESETGKTIEEIVPCPVAFLHHNAIAIKKESFSSENPIYVPPSVFGVVRMDEFAANLSQKMTSIDPEDFYRLSGTGNISNYPAGRFERTKVEEDVIVPDFVVYPSIADETFQIDMRVKYELLHSNYKPKDPRK